MFELLIGPLIIIIVMGSLGYVEYYEYKRKKQLKQLAEKLGFEFLETDENIISDYNYFQIFQKGNSRKTINIFKGNKAGFQIISGDLTYSEGKGDRRRGGYYNYCILESDAFQIPVSFLKNKSMPHTSPYRGKDIYLEDAPSFSQMYELQGKNEEEIREFFNNDVRKAFLALDDERTALRCFNKRLMVLSIGRSKAETKENFLRKVVDLGKVIADRCKQLQ